MSPDLKRKSMNKVLRPLVRVRFIVFGSSVMRETRHPIRIYAEITLAVPKNRYDPSLS